MSWSRRRFLNTSLSSSTLVAMGASDDPDIPEPFGGSRARRASRTSGFSWSFSSWAATTG